MTEEEVLAVVDNLKAALAIERQKLREQLNININLAEDLVTARADGWDEGFAAPGPSNPYRDGGAK